MTGSLAAPAVGRVLSASLLIAGSYRLEDLGGFGAENSRAPQVLISFPVAADVGGIRDRQARCQRLNVHDRTDLPPVVEDVEPMIVPC